MADFVFDSHSNSDIHFHRSNRIQYWKEKEFQEIAAEMNKMWSRMVDQVIGVPQKATYQISRFDKSKTTYQNL